MGRKGRSRAKITVELELQDQINDKLTSTSNILHVKKGVIISRLLEHFLPEHTPSTIGEIVTDNLEAELKAILDRETADFYTPHDQVIRRSYPLFTNLEDEGDGEVIRW